LKRKAKKKKKKERKRKKKKKKNNNDTYENLTNHQQLVAFLTFIGASIGIIFGNFASPTNISLS